MDTAEEQQLQKKYSWSTRELKMYWKSSICFKAQQIHLQHFRCLFNLFFKTSRDSNFPEFKYPLIKKFFLTLAQISTPIQIS